MNNKHFALCAIAAAATSASAQSFNIEFGSPDTSPSATYAAQGLPGVWNTFNGMPNFVRHAIIGLDGQSVDADIMNIGFDFIESSDIAGTTGDDERLLDDCFTSMNDPVDGCLFMRFIEPGEYRVIMYGITPDDVSLLSRMRIDQNTEGPVFVGGNWSGNHESEITFMTQLATVGLDGRLDIHSGLQSANIRSVCNGIQVIQVQPCIADLTDDGELNFFDVSAFLNAFASNDLIADFTGDGEFNFFDVSAFLNAFAAGCP